MNTIKSFITHTLTKILSILIIGVIGVQTISCSGDDSGGDPSSNSSGVATISCQTDNACVEVSADACLALNGQLVASCDATSPSSSSDEATLSSSSDVATPSSSSVSSSSDVAISSSSSTDSGGGNGCSIDGYKTVPIGTQIWMAENLNCDVEGSMCIDNSIANCSTYGRFYNWATAMALPSSCNSSICNAFVNSPHQGICPDGWHIPTNAEWNTLYRYVDPSYNANAQGTDWGYSTIAGKHLKSVSGWNYYKTPGDGNGIDTYGFTAIPAGFGRTDGSAGSLGSEANWWSTSEHNAMDAFLYGMGFLNERASWSNRNRTFLHSVRCVKDN